MKYRHSLSLLLAALLLASVGCGGGSPAADTTAASGGDTTTAPVTELAPDLPAYDGGGADFTILAKMEGTETGRWTAQDVWVEDQNGEVINDAVWKRNRTLEDKYNIVLKREFMPISGQYSYNMFNELARIIMAGDDAYDIVMPTIQDAALLARAGMLYDLRENGNVDLSMPWWSQMFDEETALDGKSYYANGDICMSFIRASYCMLFNKSLIEDYKLEDPYELVEKGEWTMDKVLELSEAFATDTNGDGEYTSADNVGLGVLNNHVEVFFTSAGCKFVEYDGNELTFVADKERTINVLENILKFYTVEKNVLCFTKRERVAEEHIAAGVGHVEWAAGAFESGKLMILAGTMNNVPSMRNMDADFGILPYPKYNEEQDSYYTYVQTWASGCAAIPVTADENASSIILEDMAYYSSKTIMPAYYETALKTKYARDDESQAMLDLLCDTRTVDIGNLYNVGKLVSTLTTNINNGEGNFVSLMAGLKSTIEGELEEINEAYNE